MNKSRICNQLSAFTICLFGLAAQVGAEGPAKQGLLEFDPSSFGRSTVIDNEWYPIQPGMRLVWDGYAVDEEGDEETHSIVTVVTDLVKEIAGVRTVVCWERDFVDKELEEEEIMFLAQDDNGDVWLLGEYPEEYDNKNFVKQSSWIHGCKDGRAGIVMKKDPKVGMTYSQGWAPSVEYTDRAVVYQVGQKIEVPAGDYDNVVVVDESDQETEGAHHLKYYAKGVGLVHVGGRGAKTDQEKLDLVEVRRISSEEMAKAREAALKLDKHGYEVSKDVYALTKPISAPSN